MPDTREARKVKLAQLKEAVAEEFQTHFGVEIDTFWDDNVGLLLALVNRDLVPAGDEDIYMRVWTAFSPEACIFLRDEIVAKQNAIFS